MRHVTFGGGKVEQLALAKYQSVVCQHWVSDAHLSNLKLCELGKCPLTHEEVGIMLTTLGFGPHTQVYLASYKVSVSSWWVDTDTIPFILRKLINGMPTFST
jgi:hypothetical protein